MESIRDHSLTAVTGTLDTLRAGTAGSGDAESLKSATEQFEAMFLSYMLKVMRSTVDSVDSENSMTGKDIYTDMFDNEIALNIARSRGLGIGDMMYEQLKDNPGAAAGPSSSKATGPSGAPADPAAAKPEPSEKQEGHGAALSPEGTSPVEMPVAVPLQGRLTSAYGTRRDPFTGAIRFHKGIDIAAPAGTPFRAASAGTVVFAGVLGGYGNAVIIENSKGDRNLYAHASRLMVRSGDKVEADQVIGKVGSTGRSTGAHLHFEAQISGHTLDPQVLLASADGVR